MFNKKLLLAYSGGDKPIPGGVGEVIVSASGRRFQRHESGMGTVMEWNNNGNVQYTIILDAMYRSITTSTLSTRNESGFLQYCQDMTNINDGYRVDLLPSDQYTDSALDSTFVLGIENRNNKVATDDIISGVDRQMIDYGEGQYESVVGVYSAIYYCRKMGCDLPTVSCMLRIFLDRAIIDSLDPTKTSTNNLTNWRLRDNFSHSSAKVQCSSMYKEVGSRYTYYCFNQLDFGGGYIASTLGDRRPTDEPGGSVGEGSTGWGTIGVIPVYDIYTGHDTGPVYNTSDAYWSQNHYHDFDEIDIDDLDDW